MADINLHLIPYFMSELGRACVISGLNRRTRSESGAGLWESGVLTYPGIPRQYSIPRNWNFHTFVHSQSSRTLFRAHTTNISYNFPKPFFGVRS